MNAEQGFLIVYANIFKLCIYFYSLTIRTVHMIMYIAIIHVFLLHVWLCFV